MVQKTVLSLRWDNSPHENTNTNFTSSSEVSNHIHTESLDHHIGLDEVKILDKEPCWFERGVREAIYINAAINGHLELTLLKVRQRFNAISTLNLDVYKFWDW